LVCIFCTQDDLYLKACKWIQLLMGWWLHVPFSGFTLESAKKVSSQIYEKKFRVFSQHHSHKQIFNTSWINLHFFFLQFNWIKLDLNSILCIWIQFKVGTQCHSMCSFELNLIFIIWIHYFVSWSTTVVHSGSSSIIIVQVVKVLW
jgi:hypothetical protein